MNETDLCESSGLERHAKAALTLLLAGARQARTHTEETGLWFFCLNMKGCALLQRAHQHSYPPSLLTATIAFVTDHKGRQLQRAALFVKLWK